MKKTLTIILILVSGFVYSQNISGKYFVNGKGKNVITISKVNGETDMYKIKTNEGWFGTGILYKKGKKKTLMAIFKYKTGKQVRGVHSCVLQDNGNLKVSIRLWKDVWNKPKSEISTVTWIKQ